MIELNYILIVSAIMMFAGIFGFLTRRSTLAILLSIELMLNSADINFAVFNRMLYGQSGNTEGFFFTLFSIAITAAESAIAIAIMVTIYRLIKDTSVDKLTKMKW